MYRILITCPPMIKQIKRYEEIFNKYNMYFFCPEFRQVMSEEDLIELVPQYDGWIIGDDPATRKVFTAGKTGSLKAAIKWGVGTDNVDFEACEDLNIPITNIPGVFGEEVSDVALGMLLNLTRKLHDVDREIKKGNWTKPTGISLSNKKVCLIGFGDIGRATARKLLAFNLNVYVSDPGFEKVNGKIICNYNKNLKVSEELNKVNMTNLDEAITNCDFIVATCALNEHTYHLINKDNIVNAKYGVMIINVARGPVIKEVDVVDLLYSGQVSAVGFDVFEKEPLSEKSLLRKFPQNFFGSHNGSNTNEAVDKVSKIAIEKMNEFLTKVK